MLRLTACFFALLLAVPAYAQNPGGRGWELTPWIGGTVGGDFEVEDDNGDDVDLDVDDSGSFGLILNFPAEYNTEWQIAYSHQGTELDAGGLFVSDPVFDVDIDTLQFGGQYLFEGDETKPFFGLTIGLSRWDPDGEGLDSENFFSFVAGLGVKRMFSDQLGVRLEGRVSGTVVDSDSSLFCSGGDGNNTCFIRSSGSVVWQWTALAGLVWEF